MHKLAKEPPYPFPMGCDDRLALPYTLFFFTRMLGIHIQALMLPQQASCPLTHLTTLKELSPEGLQDLAVVRYRARHGFWGDCVCQDALSVLEPGQA